MSKRLREWRLSRARAARADKLAAPADATEKFAKQASNLDAVRKTVEDAASTSAGLWLSYLFALFYIGIAAGAVTHKDLLLENPVKLPFLGVELPLVAFFALAPILFVISHAYTLMHFVLLAAKVGTFNIELEKKVPDQDAAPKQEFIGRAAELRDTRLGLRWQLPSNIFVQILAGPRDIRDGGLGWLLQAVTWISLVFGPVLLLLLLQIQFLPYHLGWVTWVQRFALLADMILLWFLWPMVLASRSVIQLPPFWSHKILTLASLIPIGLAFTAATFPGEWTDEQIGNKQWIPPNDVTAWLGAKDRKGEPIWTSFHDLLFNGEVDETSQRRKSPFSNTLVLPSFDALAAKTIDNQEKLGWAKHTAVLRGRHLENAVFWGADLRKADLEGAQLQGASLVGALLDGASLEGALLDGAELQRASLVEARLQGAVLNRAELQGALLDGARLQGASLQGAQLRAAYLPSAVLKGAQLQGAVLWGARLQGASLEGARLQGASLEGAHLQGAVLNRAQLQGAQLQGASLEGARLQGASLDGAESSLENVGNIYLSLKSTGLQGASLDGAQLQGANFQKSILSGANMRGAAVWRANFDDASLTAIFADHLEERALSMDEFVQLKAIILTEVPVGVQRGHALKRIETLNPAIVGNDASARKNIEKGLLDGAAYRSALAAQLQTLACSEDEDALHIVRGLIANGRIKDTGAQASDLVRAILKPDCPVSAALTEADKAALKKIATEAGGAH